MRAAGYARFQYWVDPEILRKSISHGHRDCVIDTNPPIEAGTPARVAAVGDGASRASRDWDPDLNPFSTRVAVVAVQRLAISRMSPVDQ